METKLRLNCVFHVHILNTHGLGDVIMSFPFLEALAEQAPQAVMSMTVKSHLEKEAVSLLLGTRMKTVLCLSDFRTRRWGVFSYLSRLRQLRPDMILSCYGLEPNRAAAVSYISGAKARAGPPFGLGRWLFNLKVRSAPRKHKVHQHLSLLEAIGARVPEGPQIRLNLPGDLVRESARSMGLKTASGVIGIAPGSGVAEKHKRWPVEHFSAFVRKVLAERPECSVVLLGSQEESDLAGEIERKGGASLGSNLINTVGRIDIKSAAAILRNLDVLLTNCNGLSHLAAAVGIHVVALYGPTDPELTGPFSQNATFIRLGLECSPCYRRHYIRGCGEPRCLQDIPVARVWEEVMDVLAQRRLRLSRVANERAGE